MKKAIGKALQAARRSAGFKSAKAFAEHMQYNVGTYTNWEQGKQMFSLEQAYEMANALGCTLDELGGRTYPHENEHALTAEEKRILDAYRSADFVTRTLVLRALGLDEKNVGGAGGALSEKGVA